jgi:spermidine/putrescine transport system permease protein
LETVTWAYIAWSILPVLIAVVFSFNDGRSRSSFQGLSLRWWVGSRTDAESLLYDSSLRTAMLQSFKLAGLTMLIAVPIGVAFAIGIDRWRGRPPASANFFMLFSFVVPEIILGVSLYLVFIFLLKDFPTPRFPWLGTKGQVLGLVTFQMSYAVIIVRARLLTIGKEYEEAAMDLGGTPWQAIRRVLLPLLSPAIFASAAIVFADTIDDFVIVRALSSTADTEPFSIKIYGAARGSPTPAVNAGATVMLVSTLTVVVLGLVLYRVATRGQRAAGGSTTREFAAL